MKKISLFLCVLFSVLIVGCTKTNIDEYAAYRTQSEAQIFNGGESLLAKKKYAEAAKSFEALDAVYPFGQYSQQGQLDVIYAYYMSGDDASAIAAADRYTRLYPRGENVDYAYYMRGLAGFRVGLSWIQKAYHTDPAMRDISTLQQSYSSFAILTELFPQSPYAKDSLLRMAYIRNLLARREVEVAEFYMERDAYVAAANRASYVVQHYNGSPQVADALVIMVQAYTKLGLPNMAQKSQAILLASYPRSPQAIKLMNANAR